MNLVSANRSACFSGCTSTFDFVYERPRDLDVWSRQRLPERANLGTFCANSRMEGDNSKLKRARAYTARPNMDACVPGYSRSAHPYMTDRWVDQRDGHSDGAKMAKPSKR